VSATAYILKEGKEELVLDISPLRRSRMGHFKIFGVARIKARIKELNLVDHRLF
jgi:hypothetical protein